MEKEKGQAALEYLTTYGFALIIIRRIISLQMFGIGLVEVLAKIKEKQQN